jgi:hypothetical protein
MLGLMWRSQHRHALAVVFGLLLAIGLGVLVFAVPA